MQDLNDMVDAYRQLRERCDGAMLATLAEQQYPEASYAPLVWLDGDCFVFLSELATHTHNLRHRPAISLLLMDGEAPRGNAFARPRITLQGEARMLLRDDPLAVRALAVFHQRFGEVMNLLESLPDFHLFHIPPESGRYVHGFGQAYALAGENLDELEHINPRK